MSITFQQQTLPNGLTVIAESDPAAHTAAAGFFVKTGARDESERLMGVSHFLEHMMFKGTSTRTAVQVNEHFDDLGATHNAFTSSEITAFWAHTLPENLPGAVEVLADILRPSLRPADFEEERGVILEEIAMYEDQPFWVLYEAVMERFYAGHPLRHRVLGTKQTIAAMQRDEMNAYFENRYSADNTVLALAGRVDFDAFVKAAERLCGHWQTTHPAGRTAPRSAGREQLVIPSATVNRCYGMFVAPAPAVQHEDRYASLLALQILGDSDGSRLYWSLIETGLAEEAQAQHEGRDGCGEAIISYVCSPEMAERVESVILKEIENLPGSLTADDLGRAKSKIATAVTIAGERPAGRMRRLGQLWMSLGGYRSLDDELATITRLTLDDVGRVVQQWPLAPCVSGRLVPAT